MTETVIERLFRWCARRLAHKGLYLEAAQAMVWGEYRKVDGPARNKDWAAR